MTGNHFFSILILLVISACADSRSDAIANSEFWFSNTVAVSEAGDSVSCSSSLRVGGSTGTTITLSDADTVSCGLDEEDLTAMEGSAGSYSVSDLDLTEDQDYYVRLERNGDGACGTAGTFTATVPVPAAVTITAPADASNVSRAVDLTVTWTAGEADTVTAEIIEDGETIGTATGSGADADGTLTITAESLESLANGAATLRLTRRLNGDHPDGLKGGSTSSTRSASIDITLTN